MHFIQRQHKISPLKQKSLAINRLRIIKPLGLKQPGLIVISGDMQEAADVSGAPPLRGFDMQEFTFDL